MGLSVSGVAAQQRAADLLVLATGSYSEALDANARLKASATSAAIKGDFDKAALYATNAYKAGAVTPEELIGRIITLTLVDVDKAKAREDAKARKEGVKVNPDRLTLFHELVPGIPVKDLKEQKVSEPCFAAHVLRENFQGLANKGEPAFLALLGLTPKEAPVKQEPIEFQMRRGDIGCCHGHGDV